MICQGEIYWLHFGPAEDSAPAGRRPALVVQHDRFNRSAISTTVVAAVTSNLRLGAMPGNDAYGKLNPDFRARAS